MRPRVRWTRRLGGTGAVTVPVSGGASIGPDCLAVGPNGAIVYCGITVSNQLLVGRLRTDGTPDTSFNSTGIATPPLQPTVESEVGSGLVLLPGGGIAVSGYSGVSTGNHVMFEARFTHSGGLDSTFGSANGYAPVPDDADLDSKATPIVLQADGATILGGFQPWGTSALVRLLPSGTDDGTFGAGIGGSPTTGAIPFTIGENVNQLALLPSGSVLAGATSTDFLLFRVTPAGELDPTYGSSGAASQALPMALTSGPTGLVVLPDGAAVCVDSTGTTIELARFSPGGLLETTFGNSGRASIPSGSSLGGLALMLDGSFAVALENPGSSMAVAHVTARGALDSSFGTGGFQTIYTGANDSMAITVDAAGRIVIGIGGAYDGDGLLFARLLP
jgi:uncharacterized delta-60 repeat protein